MHWREEFFPRLLFLSDRAGRDHLSSQQPLDIAGIVLQRSIVADRAFAIVPGGKIYFSGWHSVSARGASIQIAADTRLAVQIAELQRLHAAMSPSRSRPARPLTDQHHLRLKLSLMATDAHQAGSSYRETAIALFGPGRVRDGAWKTHDLRSRTIRLVKAGLDLIEGGYRKLLDPSCTS